MFGCHAAQRPARQLSGSTRLYDLAKGKSMREEREEKWKIDPPL